MKRCFNTKESMAYLGVGRRFFEKNIAPILKDKTVRAGTSVVYERVDLDNAWERYKLKAGSERANEGVKQWDVQEKVVSTRQKTGRMRSMPSTGDREFASVVSSLTKKRKTISSPRNSG